MDEGIQLPRSEVICPSQKLAEIQKSQEHRIQMQVKARVNFPTFPPWKARVTSEHGYFCTQVTHQSVSFLPGIDLLEGSECLLCWDF